MNLSTALKLPAFYNQWSLMDFDLCGTWDKSNIAVVDQNEIALGFPPFSADPTRRIPPWNESVQRPSYFALNLFKTPSGNHDYGSISVVMNKSFARSVSVITPIDTGCWRIICNTTQPYGMRGQVKCDGWDEAKTGALTEGAYDHLLLSYNRIWANTSSAIGDLFARWFGEPIRPLTSRQPFMYWEVDTLSNVVFEADAVHFIIGSFPQLFGTHWGLLLQQFCIKWGWPLVWSFDVEQSSYSPYSILEFPSLSRIIDPMVQVHTQSVHNLTITPELNSSFDFLWRHAGAVRNDSASSGWWQGGWQDAWKKFESLKDDDNKRVFQSLYLYPLEIRACSNPENCIGLDHDRSCVCTRTALETQSLYVIPFATNQQVQ